MTAPEPSDSEDQPWDEQLAALVPATGRNEIEAFLARLPAGYREQTTPTEAAHDLAEIEALSDALVPPTRYLRAESSSEPVAGGPTGAGFGPADRVSVRPAADAACTFRLRRIGVSGIVLTRILPLLESFGLVVVEAIPLRLRPGRDGAPGVHIDDIGIRADAPYGPEALRFVPEIHGPRLVEAIEACARGDADVDSLNRLVTSAGLGWRQVAVLRAYLRYWSQVGVALSWDEMAGPLSQYPDVARALTAYFEARFDPDRAEKLSQNYFEVGGGGGSSHTVDASGKMSRSTTSRRLLPPAGFATASDPSPPDPDHSDLARPDLARPESAVSRGAQERALCLAQLELVTQLEEDRVLRALLALIDATLRTSYFRPGPGPAEAPLVLKFTGPAVPDLQPPRPLVETFVHGPTVEGIHIRAGLIARGGIRWSERPLDFRTEVLDLAFAQVKKNAVIVPTGAKGGFVCRAPSPTTSPGPGPAKARPGPDEVRRAYERFIRALLGITDNLVNGQIVTPDRVVAADGPDPYLVVAADKGTATFSDLANAISDDSRFWLGDAFASGGSRGYDHKAMGITARGAWVAVRRHFRELGVDVMSDPIRVVGVGDMSGDVFGNGMLQSRAIRLIAAFDHRHVFLDPDPDPEKSFAERRRLASLERSSWADYDRGLISPGGGVWARDTKVVPISSEVAASLGFESESAHPPDLIRAILSAPVDLIWFGGIGTFIKAPDEPDVEVGDHPDDGLRITSDQVRARVIAEGANLAVTEKARIRYSRRGGRINADFIDNAAGVATSDREVNLKILLALAIERGRLAPADRDGYLERSEGEVAAEVLRQVDHSVAALNRAAAGSDRDLDAYEALIDDLETAGHLDRRVEVLPDAEEFRIRRSAGAGLIRPELATVLAFAKSDLVGAIEGSPRTADQVFLGAVLPYFPRPIRDDFADLVPEHRLYPQLVATDVAGEIVDQMGVVWAHDLAAELGRGLDEVAVAFWVARSVTGAGELWAELEALTADFCASLTAETESVLHRSVAEAVHDLTRSYLTSPGGLDAAATSDRDGDLAARATAFSDLLTGDEVGVLTRTGCSPELAERFLAARLRVLVVEAGSLVDVSQRSLPETVEATRLVDGVAGVATLIEAVRAALASSPPPDRLRTWQGRALIDDLRAWRRRAVLAALMEGSEGGGTTVGSAVQQWAARHAAALEHARQLSRQPGPGSGVSADPIAVATLVLRRLAQALDGSSSG
ncbi:MAG: NAD-glutamate dehydrogenase [Acidimicrobiales bacterium]|nr:NAD-glutamate dehydrogenase [Acidimicrobiales bacterium]